jgi:hypothetical protein
MIAGIAGAIISLVFALVPSLRQRYEQLNGSGKRIVMILTSLAVAAGLAAYDYGAPLLVQNIAARIGLTLSANQITYMVYRLVVFFVIQIKAPRVTWTDTWTH